MKYHLRIPSGFFEQIKNDLNRNPGIEQAVFCLAGKIVNVENITFVIRDIYLVPEEQYVSHNSCHFEIKDEFVSMVIKGALVDNASIVMIHIHPQAAGDACFSSVDDNYEPKLLKYIRHALPEKHFVCMVYHPNGTWAARVYPPGSQTNVPIQTINIVGRPIKTLITTNNTVRTPLEREIPEVFERQGRALGKDSYRILKRLKVGIIGVGGTGSLVNQQLAHLGVGTIVQVDPDRIEESNLSRVVGAGKGDIGTPKVEVAKRVADSTAGGSQSVPIPLGLDMFDAFQQLKTLDALFCCTDGVASRRLANRLAIQYQIPLFDMGVSLKATKGTLQFANSELRTVLPGDPCLECMGIINPDELIKEIQGFSPQGYLEGEKEPAVISFNSVIASLAVTDFLSVFTGFTNYESGLTTIHSILDGLVSYEQKEVNSDCDCQLWQGMGDNLKYPYRS